MNALRRLRHWWQARAAADDSPWDADTSAWLLSLATHLAVLVALTLVTMVGPIREEFLTLIATPPEPDDPLAVSSELDFVAMDSEVVGTSSMGDADALVSVAPTLAMTASAPTQLEVDDRPLVTERVQIEDEIRQATGPRFAENLVVRGSAGTGVVGAQGAMDELTKEILLSLEERQTLVVWFFDQSGSLAEQRDEIARRFEQIYEELGVIAASGDPAFAKHEDKPLLASIVAFGENVSFLTPKPTDDLQAIKSAIASIETDTSGIERTFTAVEKAVERFRVYRTQEPRRNVMFVIFTDEVGDDEAVLDRAVTLCMRNAIPVYCVGVPAPFGRRDVYVRYIDPDPKYDQTPQWLPVRQGPESFMPELVKIGSAESDEPLSSGFGPYGLTRLCVESGGIFLAVESEGGRGRRTGASSARLRASFDRQIMDSYRPDYMPVRDYERKLKENQARAALVEAARMSWIVPMEKPQLVFRRTSEADLANRLTIAQRASAVLDPKIEQLYQTLKQGEKDRPQLTDLRWQAGYDLSMGLVLALKVRTQGYNAMLAKAKRGMAFKDPQSDTWRLVPSDEVTIDSQLEKQAAEAKTYLERVVREHAETPWAQLAKAELARPFGWTWQEAYSGVDEARRAARAANNNPNRRMPRDEEANMIRRAPKREAPKL